MSYTRQALSHIFQDGDNFYNLKWVLYMSAAISFSAGMFVYTEGTIIQLFFFYSLVICCAVGFFYSFLLCLGVYRSCIEVRNDSPPMVWYGATDEATPSESADQEVAIPVTSENETDEEFLRTLFSNDTAVHQRHLDENAE